MINKILLATSLLAILFVTVALTEVNSMTDNQKYLKKAQAYAKEFAETKDPECLKQAYLTLEDVLLLEEDNSEIRGQLRKDSLYLWLQLMELLDQFLDPNFDPEDVPARAVQPPPTSEGVLYPPGADPAKIDDPMARAHYEKAIADNNAKIANYSFQTKLRRLDERITLRAEEFIRNFFTSAAGDQEELKAAIDGMIKTPRRKEELLERVTTFQQ